MIANHLREGKAGRLPAYTPRAKALGLLLFLGLVLGLSFPYFESTRNANELPRLMQAMSLMDTGVWAIDGPGARRIRPGPDVSRSHVDGRIYPNKPPGTTVVLAAAYACARAVHGDELTLRLLTWWARMLSGWLPTMLLAAFLVRRLAAQFSERPAMAAVVVLMLGTPAASYAHLAYGHQLAAALLVIGITLCIDAVSPARDARARLIRAAAGGALAGAAVTVEYGAVFAGIPLGVLLLWRARKRRYTTPTLLAILGALLPIAALGAYHRAVYGAVFSTGYHHVTNADFAAKHGQGFLGLSWPTFEGFYTHVLEPGGGLLWWAPLVPLGLYGLGRAATHSDEPLRTHARVALAIVILYVAIVSGLSFEGGWRVGPRYMVAVLPFVAWGWAEALGQIREATGWIVVVIGLALYAVVVNALAANLWPHLDLTNVNHPVSEVLLPLWTEGVEPYGVLRSGFNLEVVQPVIGVSVLGGLWVIARAIEPMPRTMFAIAGGVVIGIALLSGVTVWPPHAKARRNLAYIVRTWEPDREPQRRTASKSLPPLAQGVHDRGPRKKPAMVPPQ